MQEIKCTDTLYVAQDNKIFINKEECELYEKREKNYRRFSILIMSLGVVLALCWCTYDYNLYAKQLNSIVTDTKIYLQENK